MVIYKLHTNHQGTSRRKRDLDGMVIYLLDLPKTLPEEEEQGFRVTSSTEDQTFNLRN